MFRQRPNLAPGGVLYRIGPDFSFTKNFFIDAPAKAAEILAETVTEA